MRWAGAADVARCDKTEESCHVRDASVPRCRGLSQQAPPPVCSRCRRHRTRICSWTTLYSFFLCIFILFCSDGSLNKSPGNCLLLLAPAVFLHFIIFHVSFTAKVYAPGPHADCIVSKGSGAAYYILEIKAVMLLLMYSYILVHRFKAGSGRRHSPRYVHRQSTPTTKTVVRIYSCVTLFYT